MTSSGNCKKVRTQNQQTSLFHTGESRLQDWDKSKSKCRRDMDKSEKCQRTYETSRKSGWKCPSNQDKLGSKHSLRQARVRAPISQKSSGENALKSKHTCDRNSNKYHRLDLSTAARLSRVRLIFLNYGDGVLKLVYYNSKLLFCIFFLCKRILTCPTIIIPTARWYEWSNLTDE